MKRSLLISAISLIVCVLLVAGITQALTETSNKDLQRSPDRHLGSSFSIAGQVISKIMYLNSEGVDYYLFQIQPYDMDWWRSASRRDRLNPIYRLSKMLPGEFYVAVRTSRRPDLTWWDLIEARGKAIRLDPFVFEVNSFHRIND